MKNKNNCLVVSKSVLPEYFEKVIKAREMMQSGAVSDVSEAVKIVGISRSTYYKYKDSVFEPDAGDVSRRIVISMVLTHQKGILGRVLNAIGEYGANILTITQNLPISDRASVVVTLDISSIEMDVSDMLKQLSGVKGVVRLTLIDVSVD